MNSIHLLISRLGYAGAIASSMSLFASPACATPNPSHAAQDLQPPAIAFQIAGETTLAENVVLPPFSLPNAANLAAPEESGARNQASGESASPATLTAQATPTETTPAEQPRRPDVLETSPVFQQWNKEVPNVLESIRRDPAFRTRARLGLSYFPTTFDSLGWNVGIEDIFIGKTGLTVSGDYQATFTGDRKAGGAELRYYLLPLGGYFNIAPVFGYRYLETPRYITDGLNVGAKFQAVLSRTGAADISFTQTWVDPRQSEEVGISKFSFGYALTRNLRLSTDIEKQNSKKKKDTRFGISLEWMF
jgi:hypothetical protein